MTEEKRAKLDKVRNKIMVEVVSKDTSKIENLKNHYQNAQLADDIELLYLNKCKYECCLQILDRFKEDCSAEEIIDYINNI